jgi:small basic protein
MAIVSGIIGGVINVVALMFHNNVVHSVVEYLFQAVLVAFESVVGVVLYHDLRAAKEGVNTERIAAVFD